MSSQGVRIIKPLEEDFVPEPAKPFLKRNEPRGNKPFLTAASILFSSISAAFAVIVFTQASF
ncbi:MAG: hypothetical protein KBC91_02320 [Candidatus Omnitrophica bacterium]|nr:hypothetical protein [Candidatus Omnitrophota bacterium]